MTSAEAVSQEPRAPDLKAENSEIHKVELAGVPAYMVWGVFTGMGGYRERPEFVGGGFFGSKTSMNTIRGWAMDPRGKELSVVEPDHERISQHGRFAAKIGTDMRSGWRVLPVKELRYPGARPYSVYETAVWHQKLEFKHDPSNSKLGDPGTFFMLARDEEEAPELFLRKLAARTRLPLHPLFAQPLWDELIRLNVVKEMSAVGIRAYSTALKDEKLASIITRMVVDGELPSGRELLGEEPETLEALLADDAFEGAEMSDEYNPVPVLAGVAAD